MSTAEKLSGLKVGDQVAVRGGYNPYEIRTISKITPSGQIVLDNGMRFKDGGEIGYHGFSRSYLYPLTPTILDNIKRRNLRSDIDRLLDERILDQMSTKDLERVLAVLRKGEQV